MPYMGQLPLHPQNQYQLEDQEEHQLLQADLLLSAADMEDSYTASSIGPSLSNFDPNDTYGNRDVIGPTFSSSRFSSANSRQGAIRRSVSGVDVSTRSRREERHLQTHSAAVLHSASPSKPMFSLAVGGTGVGPQQQQRPLSPSSSCHQSMNPRVSITPNPITLSTSSTKISRR